MNTKVMKLFIELFSYVILSSFTTLGAQPVIDIEGRLELQYSISNKSIVIGKGAGLSLTSDTFQGNTIIGEDAGKVKSSGMRNTMVGWMSGSKDTSSNNNSFFGALSGRDNNEGTLNTFIGDGAGLTNTSGLANTFIGTSSGNNFTTGILNICLGNGSGPATSSLGTENNRLYIDVSVSDNPLIYGEFDNDLVRINGRTDITSTLDAGIGGSYEAPLTVGSIVGDNIAIDANEILARNTTNAATLHLQANSTGAVKIGGNSTNPTQKLFVEGDTHINGTLSKSAGSFKIDHPLDPANRYLFHSFVESPDMMNIYNGNVVTDKDGLAIVHLPEWFDALNTDFRYQLTTIGQFSQVIISQEVMDNTFVIRSDLANVKVSWQVTGIRQDPYARDFRTQVEVEKSKQEQGTYLYPAYYQSPLSQIRKGKKTK